jgi:carbonic anhydrase
MTACEIIAIHDMEWERRNAMTTFDTLLERNQEFAAHQFPKDVPLMPRAMIIGCVDQRVDPALLLGLGLGEAIVIRNVGGRITPATLELRRAKIIGCGL